MLKNKKEELKKPYIMILGSAQDGGYPMANCKKVCCKNAVLKNEKPTRVSSIAIVDPISSEQWIIDATPDLKEQLNELYKQSKSEKINGIFLTHAHIGHYLGLAQLGQEVIGSKKIKVYCMQRMFDFLSNNGPWDQLIKLQNITLEKIQNELTIKLNSRISITPILVPHRDEYSETVCYLVSTMKKKLLYIPDIDKWHLWDKDIIEMIKIVDYALLDGTFYQDGELGRDMSKIPHPFVKESMILFKDLSKQNKQKVFFTHLNHTNPLIIKESKEQFEVKNLGFNFAMDNLVLEL
ncbi:MBL fold metallo-hydrolase [Flavobacteriales bacterium]|nr:MBL fold metallo-hydrolase [Flavobacteriales bacterium]